MGRAPCCEKVGLRKGKWSREEDQALTNYIQANGEGSWRSLPKNAGLMRCGKSCRLRWVNYLRGNLKRGNITAEEEDTMVKLHASLGNRWSLIASHFPGRTDNEIKNYWKSHLSRKLYAFKVPFTNGTTTTTTTYQYLPTSIDASAKFASKVRRGRVSRSVAKKYNNNVVPSTAVTTSSPTTIMRKNDVPNDHQITERMSLDPQRENTETSMNHNNVVQGSGVDDEDGKNRAMGESLEPSDEEGGNWYSLFQSPVIGWGSVDEDLKVWDEEGEESFCLWDTDSFI